MEGGVVGSGGFDEIVASTYTGKRQRNDFSSILSSIIYLVLSLNAINHNHYYLGWVFGLTAENAENAQGLRAESISSMSSFNSAESASTKDKLSKLRYVHTSLLNIV